MKFSFNSKYLSIIFVQVTICLEEKERQRACSRGIILKEKPIKEIMTILLSLTFTHSNQNPLLEPRIVIIKTTYLTINCKLLWVI